MSTIKPNKQNLSSDLMAGLTFALVNIPQSMAHALLAAVNPVFALYTLMVATPVGALFTSSMFMNVSTTSALSVAAGDTLITYPESDRASILVTLVILIGVFQLVLGLFRLGWVTRFIPFSVMTGFMTGVAVLIIIGQLGDFTGYYSTYSGKILQVADLILNRESIDWPTLAVGLLTLGLIYGLGKTRWNKFSLVLALLIASGAALLLNQFFSREHQAGRRYRFRAAVAALSGAAQSRAHRQSDRSGYRHWDHWPGAGRGRQPDLPQPGREVFGYLA